MTIIVIIPYKYMVYVYTNVIHKNYAMNLVIFYIRLIIIAVAVNFHPPLFPIQAHTRASLHSPYSDGCLSTTPLYFSYADDMAMLAPLNKNNDSQRSISFSTLTSQKLKHSYFMCNIGCLMLLYVAPLIV